ncbi:unnamed protein product [Heterosigma akashiwo]
MDVPLSFYGNHLNAQGGHICTHPEPWQVVEQRRDRQQEERTEQWISKAAHWPAKHGGLVNFKAWLDEVFRQHNECHDSCQRTTELVVARDGGEEGHIARPNMEKGGGEEEQASEAAYKRRQL